MQKIKFFLLSFLFLCSGCEKKEAPEEDLRYVFSIPLKKTTATSSLYFVGYSKAEKTIPVSFQVAGQIEEIPVRVGQILKKGSLIASLKDEDFKLEVQRAEAKLEDTEAQGKNASSQYRRIRELYETESASRNELDLARAQNESLKAQIEQAISGVNLAKKKLEYTKIYTDKPNCAVSSRLAEINEIVSIGQTIAILNCGTKLEVEAAVSEMAIAKIKKGMKVNILFNAYPNEVFPATLTEVGNTSQKGSTYPVTALLDSEDLRLFSGMAAKMEIPLKDTSNSSLFLIPLTALHDDMNGTFVYIVENIKNGIGIAKKKSIRIGEIFDDKVEVLSGLKENDQLVTAGVRFLFDGRVVKVKEFSTDAASSKETP